MYTILDYAEDVLKLVHQPLVFQEIWQFGLDKDFFKKLKLTGKKPAYTLSASIYPDVRDNADTRFIKVGKNPARFFLRSRKKELTNDLLQKTEENEAKEESKVVSSLIKFKEKDLHPLLTYFAYTNINFNKGKAIYTKTIFHEKSRKSRYNEWVHPDMIGFYIPIGDWSEKLLEFNKFSDSNSIKLFSFELKKRIDKSNYREYFFQAVSNSSWSNEGYLVAAEIKADDELHSELERLSASFGIGIIHINLEDIDASKIVFTAKTKPFLDWELMNKLCDQNPDFENFIHDITIDLHGKKIHKSQYDKIITEPEDYIKEIKK